MFSFILFFIGKFYSYNAMLSGILILWIHNIIYAFEKKNSRMFFLVFNLVVFFFLIGRPTINMIKGNVWGYYNVESVHFALNSLIITLLCLFAGEYFLEHMIIKRTNINFTTDTLEKSPVFHCSPRSGKEKPHEQLAFFKSNGYKEPAVCKSDFIFALRNISLILFYFSCVFVFIIEMEKLLYMGGKDYLEFYTSFKTNLPCVIIAIGGMYKYFLCIFLSTWPKKSTAFFPLMIYVLLAVPDLLIGIRNPVVLNAVFVLLYYFIRDAVGDKEKWLGFFEKFIITLLTPIAVAVLGAYNYIRDTESSTKITKNFFDLIVDFIYKQGVSFETLCIGYESIPKIKYTGFTNYTFGGIIDYFKYSKTAQILWGGLSFGEGNNLSRALYSNSFAHRMSYTALGQEYLNGHGLGSSYILETFADFGYSGIIVFSILMGMFLAAMIYIIKGGNAGFIFVLVSLTSIYFCPRDGATMWISFLFYLHFLLPFVLCYVLAKLCVKRYFCSDIAVSFEKSHMG
jgi:oligosaccharide repeat unit polymerase